MVISPYLFFTQEFKYGDQVNADRFRSVKKHVVFFQNCKELINSVEETGQILREIRDLEDQVR